MAVLEELSCTVLHSFQFQECSNKGRLVVLIAFIQGGETLFFTCEFYELISLSGERGIIYWRIMLH